MSRENFESFVVTDPNLVDQQLDVSKLATTTPTRKELLGGIKHSQKLKLLLEITTE